MRNIGGRKTWAALGVAVAGLAGVVAVPALASIPPSYKVLVVAPDQETEATSRALVETMTTFNAFFWIDPGIQKSEIGACLTEPDVKACVHGKVGSRPVDERARPVIIVARPVKPGVSTWTCYGAGTNPGAAGSGTVTIDLSAALFGKEEARTAERRKAMRCIYAAEEESYVR